MTAPTFADYVADRWPSEYATWGYLLNDSWYVSRDDDLGYVIIHPADGLLYDDEEAWLRREDDKE